MNKTLDQLLRECCSEIIELHIPIGTIIGIEINRRAKTRWGSCQTVAGGFKIQIAKRLFEENIPEHAIKSTIIHELLHTAPGCFNHGPKWKEYAGRMNNKYGYDIKRTNTALEKGVPAEKAAPSPKHRFVCEKCKSVVERYRESRFTKNYKTYRCAKCGGRFKKEF